MIDRRAFLRRFGFGTVAAAAAASGVVDLERLLWVPGEKTIFLPEPDILPVAFDLAVGDLLTVEGWYALNPITLKPTTLLKQFLVTQNMKSGGVLQESRLYPKVIREGCYSNTWAPPVKGQRIDGRLVKRG